MTSHRRFERARRVWARRPGDYWINRPDARGVMLHVLDSFLTAEEASARSNPVYIERPRHLKPSEDLDRISELARTFTNEVFDHGASWTNVVNVRTGFEALVIIIATEPGSEV